MPAGSIGTRMNNGYIGGYSRMNDAVIASRLVNADMTEAQINFGAPIVLNGDNTYSVLNAAGQLDNFAGVCIREVRQATQWLDQNVSGYPKNELAPCLERGQVTVECTRGTPTAGGAVYVRVAANEAYPETYVSGYEAEADGANTVELPNAQWTTGHLDTNRVAEITILTRVKP